MLAYCKYKGIGVVAYSPLMAGHLARPVGVETGRSTSTNGTPFEKKLRDSDKKIIQRVEELAKQHKWTMSQVALAWTASKVTSPIAGANTVSIFSVTSWCGFSSCFLGRTTSAEYRHWEISDS